MVPPLNLGPFARKLGLSFNGSKKGMDGNENQPDTAETIQISPLALLKMLKHGRAGIPLEVMGLMLGEFVDDYTIHVVDVFAMPQTALGVSVEAIDSVFQAKMLDMFRRTGRPECVVGWYHSHPGFGCWLSNVDCATQASFEGLHPRAVAVVVDPVQSVRGKSIVHGLNRNFYSLNISYRRELNEQKMLQTLRKKSWTEGLCARNYDEHSRENVESVDKMLSLINLYETFCKQESELTPKAFALMNVGRKDPTKCLSDLSNNLIKNNIIQPLRGLVSMLTF